MKKQDFYFDLPKHLIAQEPLTNRSLSKMMIVNKNKQEIISDYFYNIDKLFKEGDVLVLNDTKVIPARLYGIKAITNAKVEILLLKELKLDVWEALVGNAKVVKKDTVIKVSDDLSLKCQEVKPGGIRIFKLIHQRDLYEILDEIGKMPLPPYIKKELIDSNRYQTVYAKHLGSAAAPTAGLHFTQNILEKLAKKGVIIKYITLHVGLGTFLPVKSDDILEHKMHNEVYEISEDSAQALNQAKSSNRRIICVGTTSIRTLEANYLKHQKFMAEKASTDIFIYPGKKIYSSDVLITNFHLPESTLMMLVSAFGGYELMMKAYQQAIKEEYRFFSFGDVMWIQ